MEKTIAFISVVLLAFLLTHCGLLTDSSPDESVELEKVQLLQPNDGETDLSTTLTFEWESQNAADNYQIMLAATDSFNEIMVDSTLDATSFSMSGLPSDSTISWKVRALADSESGPWSDTYAFQTQSSNGEEPVSTSLQSPEDGASDLGTNITFEWNAVNGISEYEIEIGTSQNFSNPFIQETVSGTSYEGSGFDNATSYYWRVKPITNAGNAEWTNPWTFNTEAAQPTEPPSSFVGVTNGEFTVEGESFAFVGTNAYYLPNYEELDPRVVDRAFDAFEEAGIKVIRMWAFYDGYDCGYSAQDSSETVIQPEPGVYNEQALQALDRVIAEGKNRGMRFILTLVNYWDDLGGICQYNTWDGVDNPSRNLSHFISDEDTQRWFKNYIEMLLTRTNTETGIEYRNEPAVFSWEIMNEAQLDGGDPQRMRDWYQEMAQYIKSIDSNHMVSTGEEGYDADTPSEYSVDDYSNTYVLRADRGTSYIMNTAIPEIDYGTAHWYPANWGFGTSADSDLLTAQDAWIRDHQEIAQSYGKPFVLGEYGFPGWGDERVEKVYLRLYSALQENAVAGDLLWQFTADWVKCWEYGGNICWPGGRTDETLYNNYVDHIQTVESRN